MREEMERPEDDKLYAERRLKEIEQHLRHIERAAEYRGQVEEMAERLSAGLDSMGFDERRELLRLLVDEIVYDDDKGRLTIKTILPLGQLHPAPREGKQG